MPTLLTADQIIAADDLRTEDVPVPEWAPPGTNPAEAFVRVRCLTGDERDRFENSIITDRETGEVSYDSIKAKLAALAIVDAAGDRLFGDHQLAALGKKSGAALARVFAVAQRLSGLSKKDMEELRGNSSAAPPASSGSA